MSKFSHIIYTRGCPRIGFTGDIQNAEGYGIVYISKDILDDTSKIDQLFLTKILQMTNSSEDGRNGKAGRDVHSVVYTVPPSGSPVMSCIHYRNAQEAESSKIHNRPVFLNDMIIGEFDQYPCSLLGASCFVAEKTPIDDYYREEPIPMGEPIDSQDINCDDELRYRAMEFAKNGRADVIRAAVWFLIQQLSLPESERKMIVIRDSEPNLRLWIAAITYSMPVTFSREISFNTNATEFNNLQKDLQYCIQKSTQKFERNFNIQNPNLGRRNFALIVGADPEWRGSEATNLVKAMMPYVVIDAKTNRIQGFEPDNTISSEYYRAIVNDDAMIQDFCNIIGEMKKITPGIDIGKLFIACNVLSEDAPYQYYDMVKSLQILDKHFSGDSCLLMHVINRLFGREKLYSSLVSEDLKNSLLVLKMCVNYVETFSFSAYRQGMVMCIAEILRERLMNLQSISLFLEALSEKGHFSPQEVLSLLIDEEHLACITEQMIQKGDEDYVVSLLTLLNKYCDIKQMSIQRLLEYEGIKDVVSVILQRSISSQTIASSVLQQLKNDPVALESYITMGFNYVADDSKRRIAWCDCVLDNGVNGGALCNAIQSSGGTPEEIESILCTMIRRDGYTSNIQELYLKYLSHVPEVGKEFYLTWYQSIQGNPDQITITKQMVNTLKKDLHHSYILKDLLAEIDRDVSYNTSRKDSELIEIIKTSNLMEQCSCPRTELHLFIKQLTIPVAGGLFSKKDRENIAMQYIKANPQNKEFVVEDGFTDSPLGKKFVDYICMNAEETSAFLIAMMAFKFSVPREKDNYLKRLASEICVSYVKRKNDSVSLLIHLKDCVDQNIVIKGDPVMRLLDAFHSDDVKTSLNELISACTKALGEYKLDGFADKMVANCAKDYGKHTAAKLEIVLKEAQAIYGQNHKGGLFGRLFGKK